MTKITENAALNFHSSALHISHDNRKPGGFQVSAAPVGMAQ
jgi:hypothetical protein